MPNGTSMRISTRLCCDQQQFASSCLVLSCSAPPSVTSRRRPLLQGPPSAAPAKRFHGKSSGEKLHSTLEAFPLAIWSKVSRLSLQRELAMLGRPLRLIDPNSRQAETKTGI